MYSFKEIQNYCRRVGRNQIIIDTNILHLLLVGIFDKSYIKKCDLINSKYTEVDFEILVEILTYFKPEIIITPTVLAEISNQAKNSIKDPHFHIYLHKVIDKLRNFKEVNFPLSKLVCIDFKILSKFGFTDVSIIEIAKEIKAVILTDEINLHAHFESMIPIIKFSYIKASKLGITI